MFLDFINKYFFDLLHYNLRFFDNFVVNFSIYSLEIFLFFSIIFILIFSLFFSINKNFLLMHLNTIFLSILILFLSIFILDNQYILNYESIFFINNFFINFFKKIILLIFLIIFFISLNYLKIYNFIVFEFCIFLLFSLLSMFLIIESIDLFCLYLLLELQSFCFYILTSLKTHSGYSTEAGLKYFILGSFSSSLFLFGTSILYGLTNLTNFYEITNLFYLNDLNSLNYFILIFSLLLILLSLLFKFGLVPFHLYIPDVYSGTFTLLTLFFLVIQKLIIFLIFINLYYLLFCYYDILNNFIIFCIILSIIIGSITALAQFKLKKLIIYSAIVNSGFIMIGFSIHSFDGLISSLLFLFIYIITTFLLFIIYLSSRIIYNNKTILNFIDLILLKKSNLILALCFCIVLFSIAGIPPLAGFYGKLFLFISAIKENYFILIFISILFTVVISYYYINLIKIMFFEKILNFVFLYNISKIESYFVSLGILFILLFFIYPKFLFFFLNLSLLL